MVEAQARPSDPLNLTQTMSPLSRFIRATPLPCIVNNAVFKPALAKTYNLRDPHNPSETLFAVSSITTEDVPRVVQSAAKAQKLWQKSSLAERRAIFNKAANVLEENLDDLAALEEAETTSTKIWSQMEWGIAKDNLRETANVVTAALRGWTHHDAGVRGKWSPLRSAALRFQPCSRLMLCIHFC